MVKQSWFDVDKNGLAKILERKDGKIFIIFELVQNAWDEDGVRNVNVTLEKAPGRPLAQLTVTDDSPEGFKFLSHAFTLFAESLKKDDVTKRGRFNIGEKMVLALCTDAQIKTTKGSVIFKLDGTRETTKSKTQQGSIFKANIKMNQKEYDEVCQNVKQLIPPKNIKTYFNDELIEQRQPITSFVEQLPTEALNKDGAFKKTVRKTEILVYKPKDKEKATIYELGIPVVETGDKFHINIQQKIPLNMDRDNVTPSYLKTLRTFILNNTFDFITQKDATSTWVNEATNDKRCNDKAVKKTVTLKFGKKRVAFDPSDPEANKIAMSKGYTVISGRSLSLQQWKNAKEAKAILPAGQVTPSPKPYGTSGVQCNIVPKEEWTEEMKIVVQYSKIIARELLETEISVRIIRDKHVKAIATYGPGQLTFNLQWLGHKFFNNFPDNIEKIDSLLIHEYGHHFSTDHLSEEYYSALCDLGAKLKKIAIEKPEVLEIIELKC